MADMKEYERLAQGWETDRITVAEKSRRIAWITAGAAATIAVLQAIGLFALLPLKTVEPYVIRVDQATGVVDTATSLNRFIEDPGEATTRYFLGRYVRAREEFNRSMAEVNYQTVLTMSSPSVGREFHLLFRPDNPESPLNRYSNRIRVEVDILNMSFLSDNTALIRFRRREIEGDRVRASTWTATVNFQFANLPMSQTERLINPLGFVVEAYRSDAEVGGS